MSIGIYLPFLLPFGETPAFKMQINTAHGSGLAFTLPLDSSGTYNFDVDWGDGNVDTITVWNQAQATHTYSVGGTYVIRMSNNAGTNSCTKFKFSNVASSTYLKLEKILDFLEMGFTDLNFQSCSFLTVVSNNMNRLSSLIIADAIFAGCSALTSLPSGIFNNSTGITSFDFSFDGCSALTSIPTDLFRYNTSAVSFNEAFYGCTSLTSIPTDLFRYNTSVTGFFSFAATFFGCTSLTSIPTDLFRYNTAEDNFPGTFRNCTSLTSIPTDLFRYNTAVLNFGNVFQGCSALTSIPTDLFRYNTSVFTFSNSFNGCSALTTVPTDTFRYNTGVINFTGAFQDCTALDTLPADLFRYNTIAVNFTDTFNGCIKLQQNDTIFYPAGGGTTRFLNQSPDFTQCFQRTSFTGTQGTAPDLWNVVYGTGTPTTTDCWDGAGNSLTSLTNYASIPGAWL